MPLKTQTFLAANWQSSAKVLQCKGHPDITHTLGSGINVGLRLLIFDLLSRIYILIKGSYVYFLLNFEIDFQKIWLIIQNIIEFCNHFYRQLHLFKGLCLSLYLYEYLKRKTKQPKLY